MQRSQTLVNSHKRLRTLVNAHEYAPQRRCPPPCPSVDQKMLKFAVALLRAPSRPFVDQEMLKFALAVSPIPQIPKIPPNPRSDKIPVPLRGAKDVEVRPCRFPHPPNPLNPPNPRSDKIRVPNPRPSPSKRTTARPMAVVYLAPIPERRPARSAPQCQSVQHPYQNSSMTSLSQPPPTSAGNIQGDQKHATSGRRKYHGKNRQGCHRPRTGL